MAVNLKLKAAQKAEKEAKAALASTDKALAKLKQKRDKQFTALDKVQTKVVALSATE